MQGAYFWLLIITLITHNHARLERGYDQPRCQPPSRHAPARLLRPPCGRLQVPAPAFGKPSHSPSFLRASSPVVTSNLGRRGEERAGRLCSAPMLMFVVCEGGCAALRRGTRRVRRTTDRPVCAPSAGGVGRKKICNFMTKTHLCRDDLCTADCSSGTFGQMAIKVPLGSRCAHRAVSFWETASQDAGAALRTPRRVVLDFPFPHKKRQVTPSFFEALKKCFSSPFRRLVTNLDNDRSSYVTTPRHDEQRFSQSVRQRVNRRLSGRKHNNTAGMRSRRARNVMRLTAQPGCTSKHQFLFLFFCSFKSGRSDS